MTTQKTYPYILIIGSIIGIFASFFLTLDTIKLIENPAADLPCNLNPFVSCVSAATSWQGKVFGFPNSLLGLVSFSMLFAIGVMLFSGGRSRKPLWLLVNLGTFAAMLFVVWFFYQSVYNIRSLCVYCMTVWTVTWPIFLYTSIWNFKEDHFVLPPHRGHLSKQKIVDSTFSFVSQNHLQILFTGYLLVIISIIYQFRDFFLN